VYDYDEVSMHSFQEITAEFNTSPKDLSQRTSLFDVAIEVESAQVSASTKQRKLHLGENERCETKGKAFAAIQSGDTSRNYEVTNL